LCEYFLSAARKYFSQREIVQNFDPETPNNFAVAGWVADVEESILLKSS
jgi:hypothetical protein